MLQTGKIFPGRPAVGSWITYALGTENQNLPAYIVLRDPAGYNTTGKLVWSSGFLSALYQGVEFNSSGAPGHNLHPARPLPPGAQRDRLDFLAGMNAQYQRRLNPPPDRIVVNPKRLWSRPLPFSVMGRRPNSPVHMTTVLSSILAVLHHQKFFSLAELNESIATLLERLNHRPFRKREGTRASLFEAIDHSLAKREWTFTTDARLQRIPAGSQSERSRVPFRRCVVPSRWQTIS